MEKIEEKVKSYGEVEREHNTKEMKMKQQKALTGGSTTISATISHHLWELAKTHQIGWSEALRVGISILLADKGHMQYDNKLNIWRKMNFFRQQAEQAVQNVEELTMKLAERENIKMEKKEDVPSK